MTASWTMSVRISRKGKRAVRSFEARTEVGETAGYMGTLFRPLSAEKAM